MPPGGIAFIYKAMLLGQVLAVQNGWFHETNNDN